MSSREKRGTIAGMGRKTKLVMLRSAALRQDGGIAEELALPMLTLYLFIEYRIPCSRAGKPGLICLRTNSDRDWIPFLCLRLL